MYTYAERPKQKMNERIKELAEQARAECFRFGSKPATTVGYDELEKFAELIVRECILISRTSTDGFTAGRRMEEHFGVEE